MRVTVDERMFARVGGQVIHPVYGTAPFVEHVERLGRELLEPRLREDTAGVGYRLQLAHHAPAPLGASLEITAKLVDEGPRHLVCEVEAWWCETRIASATFEQRIVDAVGFATRCQPVAR